MSLIILINDRNVYCWSREFYNPLKALFPPSMEQSICYGDCLASSGSSGLCGSRKDKSKQVLNTSLLQLPFIAFTYLRTYARTKPSSMTTESLRTVPGTSSVVLFAERKRERDHGDCGHMTSTQIQMSDTTFSIEK